MSLSRPSRTLYVAARSTAQIRAAGTVASASATPVASALPRQSPSTLDLTPPSAPVSAAAPWTVTCSAGGVSVINGTVNDTIGQLASAPGAPVNYLARVQVGTAVAPTATGEPGLAGPWLWVYLQLANGLPPLLAAGAQVPLDSEETEYVVLAGVRGVVGSAGALTWETNQFVSGNIRHRFKLPWECTLTEDARGARWLDVRRGRLFLTVGDVAAASYWSDTSSYSGTLQYEAVATSVSVPRGAEYSVWIAVEYPKTGARLAAANHGKLMVTPAAQRPASMPWIGVAQKSLVADAARPGSDSTVPTKPAAGEGAATGGGGDGSGGSAIPAGEALAGLRAQVPPGATEHYLVTYSLFVKKDYGYTVSYTQARIHVWATNADGKVVFDKTTQGLQSLTVTAPTPEPSEPYAAGAAMFEVNYGTYSQTKPPASPSWNQAYTQRTAYSGLGWLGNALPAGNSVALISNGVATANNLYVALRVVTAPLVWQGSWVQSGQSTDTRTVLHDFRKGFGGMSTTDNMAPADGAGNPAVPSSPGRPDRSPAAPSQGAKGGDGTGAPSAIGATDKNAATVKAPGPGVYVYEIARIFPDGTLQQRITGDIYCHPAMQVQLRSPLHPAIANPTDAPTTQSAVTSILVDLRADGVIASS